MSTRSPRDTSVAHPLEHIAGMIGGNTTSYIESMEAAGQRELLFSDTLPTDLGFGGDIEAYKALGFTFGEVTADLMFREATLPEGWKREGSSYSMWSYIVDADGYRRVAIFYKAAFYDRSAHMRIVRLPETAAQSNSYDARKKIEEQIGGDWMSGTEERVGPDVVYTSHGRRGKAAQLLGGSPYDDDGRRLEITVAPDGTITRQHAFVVEPEVRAR